MLPQSWPPAHASTLTAVGSGDSNPVVSVLLYDRVPWVAQFGRDNFVIRGGYPASIPSRAGAAPASYRPCPDHWSRLAEAPSLRHAGLSRPAALSWEAQANPLSRHGCSEWPSVNDISIPPASGARGYRAAVIRQFDSFAASFTRVTINRLR
jgi:hypothetical protein